MDDKNTQKIDDDSSTLDSLFVVFQNQGYRIAKEDIKQMFDAVIEIRDKAIYTNFWKVYKRPPLKEYQNFIIERRDLLVPQDVRERKGAFFTPRIWVELSQKYLTDYLGENWQDDYFIWDCAAGTGNLLAGLTNKYNIYASTLDQADINVMHERIDQGANLLKNHLFQFDFLNDDFSKLPESLQEIIKDPEKRKKLVVYINPPYAENAGTKAGVSFNNIHTKYYNSLGKANRELFAQFLIRIYKEIPEAKIANFSKLKNLQAPNFKVFRQNFQPKLEKLFLTPANTFDNVKGKFPIGFFIWNGEIKENFKEVTATVYNKNGQYICDKNIYSYEEEKGKINDWLKLFKNKKSEVICYMNIKANDFQHNNRLAIGCENVLSRGDMHYKIGMNNMVEISIYFAVRHSIEATWLNDRDQFLHPKDGWQEDLEFQNDCLAFTLFHSQNRISSKEGVNNWMPFTEQEVDAQNRFESHFLTDFIQGKISPQAPQDLLETKQTQAIKREFSDDAKAVFNAGKKLWKHYHQQANANANASLYDIREHFQGRNARGRMNNRSDDETYTKLLDNLRRALSFLASKIKPKIYEYEFLKSD